MTEKEKFSEKAVGRVIARAWSDDAYKQQLLSDPAGALDELGVEIQAGISIAVVENTADTVHLVLPMPPSEGELSDDALGQVVGGHGGADTENAANSAKGEFNNQHLEDYQRMFPDDFKREFPNYKGTLRD
jgi:hypothetical protein